ncbi:hypothetical protein BJY24_005959 [Nocardia transvalensis]|uniref:DUF4333 domain-containing protein n=1 Tax=Nocardia transvalensis TaxID=37333 RepID=A0A7W9PIZ6_9NOCA|nr:DUF4333 domain-containing protein [Nocardia transvalensis]MBB5917047.1 hypothetical protein [Nocardia transvalensis]
MSGPYGPSDTPGPGEGRPNDPTQQWGGQQQPSGPAGPTQQWGGQQQGAAQPTQQWGGQQGGGQPWAQSQPGQPQPGQPQPGQPQAGQQWNQPPQPQWGQQSSPSWPQQQPPQQQAWEPTQQQWGQPPQQWGAQQPPGQQWPQQPDLQVTKAKKSKKGPLLVGGAVLVIVVVAVVLGFVFLSSDKLDNKAVQDGIQKVLKDSYGIDDVQEVTCPSGQKVDVGKTFDCTLKVGGEQKKVTVKITKDDGTYEVGRPN